MKAYWKRKWLTALRSGEYKQSRGRLRSDYGGTTFCCIGVLYDLPRGAEWNGQSIDGERSYLSLHAQKRFGVDGKAIVKLVNMNDGGKSFPTIANWIEANL